ncbi:MAG: DUF4363 family protein [Christensenellaceae bacterium]
MVKSVISLIICSALIISGAIIENLYMKKSFNELIYMLDAVYEKFETEEATQDDVLAVQNFWLSKKTSMHAYIPHTELKELDLWISECVTYTKYEKYEDAQAKIEVVKELCEQIPKSFMFKFENIF